MLLRTQVGKTPCWQRIDDVRLSRGGVGFCLVLIFFCFVAVRMPASAGEPSKAMIAQGEEIFEREWNYSEADQLSKNDLRSDARSRTIRPGDGLGPMFNAKSCAACHESGGAAGIKQNVTLLTLDPRSPAIELARTSTVAFGFGKSTATTKSSEQKLQVQKRIKRLFPALIDSSGQLNLEVVVHEASTRDVYDVIREDLAEHVPGGIDATWFQSSQRTSDAIADRPVVAGRMDDLDFYLSQRNSPPLFGLGLIDRINIKKLESIARNQNRKSKGVVTGRVGIGKFGWRAQTASLSQFVRGACAGELGLQIPGMPQPDDVADDTYLSVGLDLNEQQVVQLTTYVRTLPAPIQVRRNADVIAVARDGKKLFTKVGCATCHVENVSPAFGIYSDLLLHDMGDLLQASSPAPMARFSSLQKSVAMPKFDGNKQMLQLRLQAGMQMEMAGMDVVMDMSDPFSPQSMTMGRQPFSGYNGGPDPSFTPVPYALRRPVEPQFPYGPVPANVLTTRDPAQITWDMLQREWRTTPLWGVADSAPYLHDGRAKTLDAAIRWHDGEAKASATAYRSLAKDERKLILSFLKTLRAPVDHVSVDASIEDWLEDAAPVQESSAEEEATQENPEDTVDQSELSDLLG
ncbi:MAG: hypothetical protein HKN47_23405 [Pirellulaceae bacterium]|nr:hypothetical protein [Pirellulaceae bacterium]